MADASRRMNACRQGWERLQRISCDLTISFVQEAKMETQAGDKTPGTSNKFSTLDWPSPEVLMAARRARAQAVRDMTLGLCRRLRRLVLRSLTPSRSCREHPARPDPDSLSKAARETLARAWLEN
jgi:hypothetical protein